MKTQIFLLAVLVSSVFLSGCASIGTNGATRDDIRIQKMSEENDNTDIGGVHVFDKENGTEIKGSVHKRNRYSFLSGHLHFDLYNHAGVRLESTQTNYRTQSKKRGLNKISRFTGRLESRVPEQARIVVTHHDEHNKEETLQERLNAKSDGRLLIE